MEDFDIVLKQRKVIDELIETIDKELFESTQTRYHCINGQLITTDVGYVEEWWNEYKNVLRSRYCKNNVNIKTQADKIRNMTDEELAEAINKHVDKPCNFCKPDYNKEPLGYLSCDENCVSGILRWLREEMKEGF